MYNSSEKGFIVLIKKRMCTCQGKCTYILQEKGHLVKWKMYLLYIIQNGLLSISYQGKIDLLYIAQKGLSYQGKIDLFYITKKGIYILSWVDGPVSHKKGLYFGKWPFSIGEKEICGLLWEMWLVICSV